MAVCMKILAAKSWEGLKISTGWLVAFRLWPVSKAIGRSFLSQAPHFPHWGLSEEIEESGFYDESLDKIFNHQPQTWFACLVNDLNPPGLVDWINMKKSHIAASASSSVFEHQEDSFESSVWTKTWHDISECREKGQKSRSSSRACSSIHFLS